VTGSSASMSNRNENLSRRYEVTALVPRGYSQKNLSKVRSNGTRYDEAQDLERRLHECASSVAMMDQASSRASPLCGNVADSRSVCSSMDSLERAASSLHYVQSQQPRLSKIKCALCKTRKSVHDCLSPARRTVLECTMMMFVASRGIIIRQEPWFRRCVLTVTALLALSAIGRV